MYKILIADDECWVGKWLCDILKKSSLEIEVLGVCQDGEEAMDMMKETPADILITDINMPVVTGLELIKQTRLAGQKPPKTIVISGYDEFEYARQAIELEVLAYLIKPLEREAVFEALEKAIAMLNREQRQTIAVKKGNHASVENILRQIFYRPQESLLEPLRAALESEGLRDPYYFAGFIQNTKLEYSEADRESLQKQLEEVCKGSHVFLFRREVHTWCFFVAGVSASEENFIRKTLLQKSLKDHSLGISRLHQGLEELTDAVREAKSEIMDQLTYGEAVPIKLETEMIRDFTKAVKGRDKEKITRYSHELEERFTKPLNGMTDCLNFYFVLTGEVLKLLTDSFQEHKETRMLELIDEGYEFCVQIREFYSIGPICRKFLEYSLRVVDCLKESEVVTVSATVQKVQRMIREQYASDLSLGAIADEFDISPSYFSKKFKDETGMNFMDYLSSVRIEQAQALLKNTDMSIVKISEKTGYHNPNYFSRAFTAVTGERPSDYRNRYRGGKQG